jgi:integrase
MRWSEIHGLNTSEPKWIIPGQRTKNKHPHIVPLSPAAVNLLLTIPRHADLVFTTTGRSPVSGFSRAKLRLDAKLAELREREGAPPLEAWRLHDLRRSMVTGMSEELGVLPHVVEAIINHLSGVAKRGVAGVYNRALYLRERRVALERWAELITVGAVEAA